MRSSQLVYLFASDQCGPILLPRYTSSFFRSFRDKTRVEKGIGIFDFQFNKREYSFLYVCVFIKREKISRIIIFYLYEYIYYYVLY